MSPDTMIVLWKEALLTVAYVGGPFLVIGLLVGVIMSIIQAATQIQENALSFVPKLAVLGVLLAVIGSEILGRLASFSASTIGRIVDIGRSVGS